MKIVLILLIIPGFLFSQHENVSVKEIDNSIFKTDSYWRGADGAATVELPYGGILWLFSDTFIDQDGTGKRSNARHMIRNSIAIQDSTSLFSDLTFYFKGPNEQPEDFFPLPGDSWLWTGHGIMVNEKLVIFLIEEVEKDTGSFGFEAIGWYVAVIDNPNDNPDQWKIHYLKGTDTFGIIVGSSAVLKDEAYVYAFGEKEPSTHETYLLRIENDKLITGDFSNLQWWQDNRWTSEFHDKPEASVLFIGQTEFSVHYDKTLEKFVQIQTYGFGKASIGYRLADHPYGPWSEPVLFFTPEITDDTELVYTANSHPEFKSGGLIITYNVNSSDLSRLIINEDIYFPKIIEIHINKDK